VRGLEGERVTSRTTIRTADGLALMGRWWEPVRPRGSAVVLAHGLTGSKDDPRLVAAARALSESGHLVLAYDGRGHQGSEGICTLGDLERFDVAAAVGLARVRADRVVTVGASMGAIAVLRYAVSDPNLAGVVSVSSPAWWHGPRNARALLATAMTRTKIGRAIANRRLHVHLAQAWNDPEPPAALVARIASPLAIVHGRRDHFVASSEAIELAAAAPDARLLLVPEMGHSFDPAAVPVITEAVQWTLASA
jgi:pimeloyl-ACP methyl ester carboxylesterase